MKRHVAILLVILLTAAGVSAQNVSPAPGERIFVRGGIAEVAVENKAEVDLGAMTPDSLYKYMSALDSLRADGARFDRDGIDSLVTSLIDRTSPAGDSLSPEEESELIVRRKEMTLNSATVRHLLDDRDFTARYIDGGVDTLLPKLIPPDTLSGRERRRAARLDTTGYRYNNIFRDSIKLSPMVAISMVVPGFSQLYNEDYWKIPVLYGTVAAGVGVWAWQTKQYKPYKRLYDRNLSRRPGAGEPGEAQFRSTMTELQSNMIRHNTYRQLALGFSVASYLYFLADGALNYQGTVDHVKKATTLATVLPGAGQVYNKTYWKLPVVIGGAAVLIYCVDFNNRGYQRFRVAYDALTDDDENTIDEFNGEWDETRLAGLRDNYRRNRDLCMILTGLFYIIQLVDAHATAHMQTYDVSDDLSNITFGPMMDGFYSARLGGRVDTFGFSLDIRF